MAKAKVPQTAKAGVGPKTMLFLDVSDDEENKES